ncbi:hypothetical protein [Vreelandella sulfidaeris]|uniref:Uncharacterized protein n=1 Tax=Vreelandella sulfidaeris TaxID=115553 RepID=A0A455U8A5_9GAMM|nr:hypothetical protein HSBAA_30730 [Halomonas sulfidaeris]
MVQKVGTNYFGDLSIEFGYTDKDGVKTSTYADCDFGEEEQWVGDRPMLEFLEVYGKTWAGDDLNVINEMAQQ